MKTEFVHLRVHTEYSLVDGLVRIKPLIKACVTAGMPAVGVTDQVNLFAAVKFYNAAVSAGIKPIIGADVLLRNSQNTQPPFLLTLLCQNVQGYKNLTQLISRAYLEGQIQEIPILEKKWLENCTEGLIALSGGRQGDIGYALISEQPQEALKLTQEWLQLFPDRFYLELQRTGREKEEEYLQAALALAQQYHVPVVATNDVRFIEKNDFEAHEARICIQQGFTLGDPRRVRQYSDQQYLRTPQEMQTLFADIPEAIENTVEIAKRCSFAFDIGKVFLPHCPIPEGFTAEDYLVKKAQEGLKAKLGIDKEVGNEIYFHRVETELKVISSMGYAGYFLIVADFIQWAKEQKIPVGPGRGSGAGSLVAYALNITDLDPLKYDLLFERFLNPERISMPDFDIDFCMEGRDRVIDYVADRYGRDSVSQIITYGSMAAKAVVRDVGRILGHPYSYVDTIAKLIPFELGITLDKALEQEEELRRRYETEEEVRILIELARKLEGIARNAGKHAGGVVIAPSKIVDFMPLYCESTGQHVVTQFDKDDVEAIGLVKFDFLGLRTLTIIEGALQTINQQRQENNELPLEINKIPLEDKKTFSLLKACETTAVFQLESRGMKDLVKRLQLDSFEDIIALLSLFRPGPLQSGMVDDFINRKQGRSKVEYLHPNLEPILRSTYGIILYQEQVMQIAQVLAGYTLGAADLLRRAMGKKKASEMAKQREFFVKGARQRNVSEQKATLIFDLMEKFAGYGFNKSHSAAYALIVYQTAWLKAHYPSEFMAAVLSSDMDKTEKVVVFIDECRTMKLNILSPSINKSFYKFTVTSGSSLLYGLGAIKGVGEAAISLIVEERNVNGAFKDLFDFCKRLDLRKINRRVIESLIRAGAFDEWGQHRGSLLASLDMAIQMAEQYGQAAEQGQTDLFGNDSATFAHTYVEVEELSKEQQLLGEKETLGHYLSGHPLQSYEEEFSRLKITPLSKLDSAKNQNVLVAGIITGIRTLFNKRGERMAFVTLTDKSARLELAVFSDVFTKYKELIVKDKIVVVEGEVSRDEFTGGHRISSRQLFNIEQVRAYYARRLLLKVDTQSNDEAFMSELMNILKPFQKGKCPVWIDYQRNNVNAQLALGAQWQVDLKDELLHRLVNLIGQQNVSVEY